MKKITYTCDLCKETNEAKDLYSLYWDSTLPGTNRVTGGFGSYRLSDPKDADKHICKTCVAICKSFKAQ